MWIHDLPSLLTDEALATDAQIRAAVAATAGTTTTWLEYLVSTGALDEVALVHASSRSFPFHCASRESATSRLSGSTCM